MLSDYEKHIYNVFLRTTRTAAGKPYKLRKVFDDVDPSTTLYVQRIGRILNKFKHISAEDFFTAPFKLYGADEYYDLKFFASQRALKSYTTYIKQEVDADPDSVAILQRVANSLKHIKDFMIHQRLDVASYAQHMTNNLPSFVLHLKERMLSPYVMQEIPHADVILRSQDADVMRFMFGDNFFENLNIYRTRYLASSQCKQLVRAGIRKISSNSCTSNNIV
jgi:hypothetical protein